MTRKRQWSKISAKMEQEFRFIPFALIDPPSDPGRLEPLDEEVRELADSIKSSFLINPLTVFAKGERFEVAAGHRRYLACKMAEKDPVPCIIIENIGNLARTILLTENVQRRDMTPIEEAAQIKELQELNSWGYKLLAAHIGKSTQWVRDRLALLDMPPDITILVHHKQLGISAALELARITDDNVRKSYTTEAISQGSSVATIKLWCDLWVHAQGTPGADGLSQTDVPVGISTPPPTTLCQLCDDRFTFEKVRSLIICTGCMTALAEAKRENARMAANPKPGSRAGDPLPGDTPRVETNEA